MRDAGDLKIDLVAFERDALGPEPLPLLLSYGQGAVGADHAPPRQAVRDLAGGEKTGRKPRRSRRDITVGADEPLRYRADRVDDLGVSVRGDA
jgi:hypothetical protein